MLCCRDIGLKLFLRARIEIVWLVCKCRIGNENLHCRRYGGDEKKFGFVDMSADGNRVSWQCNDFILEA